MGLEGAAFPWRTIHGKECSGYWPASTAAFHINAAVADAVLRYLWATGDDGFVARTGLELLVATARLWMSLGHDDPGRGFRIDGVTGPDEYSAIADNNVYTNLMAQRNLVQRRRPGRPVRRDRPWPSGSMRPSATRWRKAAGAMIIPYDRELGVHPQSEGFTRHDRWNFAATGADQYPLLLHFPYFDLYRKQVVKQPDLVMAMFIRGDAFSLEEKTRNFAYYEALTVRDSSLSACVQSIVAAEVGQLELAYDYLGEAALIDLDDLEHNTRDGLHIASLAGPGWRWWRAGGERLVGRGQGGSVRGSHAAAAWRWPGGGRAGVAGRPVLTFAPRLPQAITRLRFRLTYLGRRWKWRSPRPRPPIPCASAISWSWPITAPRCGCGRASPRPAPSRR